MLRDFMRYVPNSNREKVPRAETSDPPERLLPSLDTLVPDNPNLPYDMHELIRKVADDGDFFELQPNYADNIITGFRSHAGFHRRLRRQSTNGVSRLPRYRIKAVKRRDLSVTAMLFRFRLITFVDVPGFLPGTAQEFGGIIKHGAKLLYAYAEATVPKITVITRKAYGGAYDVMASKHLRGDLNYAWPSAEIAVMGPKGAVGDYLPAGSQ